MGLYCSFSYKILLGSIEEKFIPPETITSIINHEVLHAVLDRTISFEVSKLLDVIQTWNSSRTEIIFRK